MEIRDVLIYMTMFFIVLMIAVLAFHYMTDFDVTNIIPI